MKIGFGNQCLLGLFLGAFFGLLAPHEWIEQSSLVGDAFLQLLKMIIIPLTFPLIVSSFIKIENISHLKLFGFKTLIWFLFTAIIAACVGLGLAYVLEPGVHIPHSPLIHLDPNPSFKNIFLNMIPGNLLSQGANGQIIPIIIFAILFGLALSLIDKKEAEPLKNFFTSFTQVMFKITRWIIRLSPIGIFSLISQVTSTYGLSGLLPFASFILCVYGACFIQMLIYLVIISFSGINPITYLKAIWPAILTAFTTSSSLGTLPVTINTLVERLGIPSELSSFVAPLGATMKMDGCGGIYPAVVALFTANLFHIHLGIEQYITIVLTCAIATIGTAGVPGTASVMAMVVLSSLGLPLTGLAMVVGIDKIIDMVRTVVNVTGTITCTTMIASSSNKY